MNRPIIIVGGGGHARVVADALACMSHTVFGYLAPLRSNNWNALWLGDDECINDYPASEYLLANGIGSVGDQSLRMTVFNKFKQLGYDFLTIVHPSAVVAKNVNLDEGCQIMAGAVLQTGVQCGENVLINTRAGIDHDCRIGAHSHVSVGATLSGEVTVSREVHVGAGSTVIQGISIGNSSVVGAGAVVIRDVPNYAVVAGMPAKRITE